MTLRLRLLLGGLLVLLLALAALGAASSVGRRLAGSRNQLDHERRTTA
jgi:hypothetical protein